MDRAARLFLVLFTCSVLSLTGCAVPFAEVPLYSPTLTPTPYSEPTGRERQTVTPTALLPASGQKTSLTLNECIVAALQNHRNIRIANRTVTITQDLLDEAWTPNLPRLTVEGQYEIRHPEQSASFFGQKIILSEKRGGVVSGRLELLLYDFGRAGYLRDVVRSQIEMDGLSAEKTRQDLTLRVSQAYFYLLEAQRVLDVIADSIRITEEQLKIASDFFGQGLVNKNDVLTVEVQLADRRQEQIHVANLVRLAIATLNRLMARALDSPLVLADVVEVTPWQVSCDDVVTLAMQKRPDLISLRHKIEAVQSEYRATRADLAPTIGAYGSGYYSSEEGLGGQKSIAAGVAMQWNLFDGGLTYKRLQRQEKEITQARDRYAEQSDEIELEVKKAYLKVLEASQRIPVAQQGVKLAEENLRVTRDLYGQGLVTSTDVLREDDRRSSARVTYYRALYEYHLAVMELTHAAGGQLPQASQTGDRHEATTH